MSAIGDMPEKLAMHLIGKHADPMAICRSWQDNAEAHLAEHTQPGGIRHHPTASMEADEEQIERVLEEIEEMEGL